MRQFWTWILPVALFFTATHLLHTSHAAALPSARGEPLSVAKTLPRVAASANPNSATPAPGLAPSARVLAEEKEVQASGATLRVQIVADPALRYPVRIEELLERMPDGREVAVARLAMAGGHVLARLNRGVTPAAALARLRPAGVVAVHSLKTASREVRLEVSESAPRALPRVLEALRALPNLLAYAEPDYLVYTTATQPNDPQYLAGELWGLRNTGLLGGLDDADIDADDAWSTRTDASDIIVAVVDTGIRYTHQDLAANMWSNPAEVPGDGIDNDQNGLIDDVYGYNAINETGNPNDDNGHGTHVAGTIGALGNNAVGVVGVAWRVRLMSVKFLSSNGRGFVSDGIEAIDYAREMGAHIMNNSWGSTMFSQSLADAIERTRQAGIIFVAAAGNNAASSDVAPHYPAAYPHDNIVSVASSTRADDLSSFSNYGLRTVDLAAPGSAIVSTYYTSDSAYRTLNGTSMAAPHVAGAMALVKAQFPGATYSELIDRVLATADRPASLSQRLRSQGRLNLARAMTASAILPLPAITEQPRAVSVIAGSSATFNVTVQGGAPLAYQWRRNGFPLSGATAPILTLTNVQSGDAGRYTVLITNPSGLALSEEAVLTVVVPVTIVTQPQGATLPLDATFSAEVSAVGDGPISYQWRKDGTNIPGGTSANFRIYGVTPNDAGAYSVLVSNAVSRAVSASAILTVLTPPVITLQPADQVITMNRDGAFTVAATGSAPLRFQWFKDGVPIPAATSPTLTLNNVQAAAVGSYAARVTNGAGVTWSLAAGLTVRDSQSATGYPRITQHPSDQTVNAGSTVTFSAAATPTGVTYQWFKNGVLVPAATAPTLTLTNVSATSAAVYTLIASNPQGRAASHAARLIIREGPSITAQPQSVVASPGAQVVLEVTATGTDPLSYQWYKDGQALTGSTDRRLFLSSVATSHTGTYTVGVSNLAAVVISSPATLSLTTAAFTRWRQLEPGLDMSQQYCVAGAPDGLYIAGSSGVLSFSADGGHTWTRRRAMAPGREITGVAYANGRYVAIGSGTTVENNVPFSLTSPDGISWTRHNQTRSLARLLRHDGSVFYCVSGFSTDGIAWTPIITGSSQSILAMIHGAGRYVVVGYRGTNYVSTNLINWVPVNSGTTQHLWAVCHGGPAGFVAVGEDGAVVTSLDGLSWTLQSQVTSQRLNGVAFGNNRYVAVGGSFITGVLQEAVTLISNDGISWRRTSNHSIDNLTAVEFANGLFVAVGGGGHVFTSEDGETWTDRRPPDTQRLYGIAEGNGVFVAVGDEGVIRNSQDGLTWVTERPGQSEMLRSIGFGAGRFVAGAERGTLYVSTNAVDWQHQLTGAGVVSCIRYLDDRFFVLTDSGEILTSSDAASWRLAPQITGAPLKHITRNASRYVIAGYDGTILTSLDAQNWTQQPTPTRIALYGVAWGATQFVAVGLSGVILTSPDGLAWTSQSAGTNAWLAGVAYGNGLFVAVGEQGLVLTSYDGITWAQQNSGTPQYFDRIEFLNGRFVAAVGGFVAHSMNGTNWIVQRASILRDVAFGNGQYVGVGFHGRLFTSTDLLSWFDRGLNSLTSYVLTDVRFFNGQFLASGRNGNILTSPDGQNWTAQNRDGLHVGLEELAYGAGRYVAVGNAGFILHSEDAITWNWVHVPDVQQWNGVAFGAGQFVAVGWPGGLATSPDGINWTRRALPTSAQFMHVAYGNDTFVAIASSGEIIVSTDGITWAFTASYEWLTAIVFSGGQFVATGSQLLTSSDGINWTGSDYDSPGGILALVDYHGAILGVGGGGLIGVSARPPEITSQPISREVHIGAAASLSVTVTNQGPPRYQWFKNGQALPGATDPVLSWARIGSADAGEYFVRIIGLGGTIDSIRAVVSVAQPPFDAWRIAHFGETNFLDPSKEHTLWGPSADPDGDTLSNLAEYAHGLSPLLPNSGSPITAEITSGRLTVTFTQRTDNPALRITPQVSGDLSDVTSWYGGPGYVEQVAVAPITPELQRVSVMDIAAPPFQTPRFLRLRIDLND